MELLAIFNTIMNTDYETEDVVVAKYVKGEYLDLLASPDLLYFEGMCRLTNSSYQDKHTGDAYKLLHLVSKSLTTSNTQAQYLRNSAIQNLRYTEIILNGLPKNWIKLSPRGTAKKYEEPPHTAEKLERLQIMAQGYLDGVLRKFKPFHDFLITHAIKLSELPCISEKLKSFSTTKLEVTTEKYNVGITLEYPHNGILCLLCTFIKNYLKKNSKPFLYKEQKEKFLSAMKSRLEGDPDLFKSFEEKVFFDLPFYVKPIEELIGDFEELKKKVYGLHSGARISTYLALKDYEVVAKQVLFAVYTSVIYEDRSYFSKSMYLLETVLSFRNKYKLI